MKIIGRWHVVRDRTPRRPRKLGVYTCKGCGWYWQHTGRNRWFGPFWPRDSQGGTGYPRWMTWKTLADQYGDCAPALERHQ